MYHHKIFKTEQEMDDFLEVRNVSSEDILFIEYLENKTIKITYEKNWKKGKKLSITEKKKSGGKKS